MNRSTHSYLTTLHDNMTRAMLASEHTAESRVAEKRLFAEASRLSGEEVTGYESGSNPLSKVFRAAMDAHGAN